MRIDIPNLVETLQRLPGTLYTDGRGTLIILDFAEKSVLFAVREGQIRDEDIDIAVAELALNHG